MAELKLKLVLEALERVSAPFKTATNATNAMKSAMREATAAVKSLEATAANVEAFRRLKIEGQANAQALAEAQARAQKLGAELAEMEKPTRAAKSAFNAARAEVDRLKQAQISLTAETGQMRQKLGEAGINTRNLAQHQRDLKQQIDAARHAAQQQAAALDAARAKMDAMSAARQRLNASQRLQGKLAGGGAAAMATGGAAIAAEVPMVKAGADFETKLATYGLTADLTLEKLNAVRDRLRIVTTETGQSMGGLMDGLAIMVGKGMDPDAALKALSSVGRAVTATGAEMSDMSTLAFSVMDNLKVAPEELAKAFDIMAKAGDEGGFELRDMAKYFPQLTSAAAMLGLTGSEAVATLSAALQVATKGAADPAEAANNMANFLKAATSEETRKNFEKQGIDIKSALIDGVKQGGNPLDILMAQIGKSVGVDFSKEINQAMDEAGGNAAAAAAALTSKFNLSELFHDAQVQNYLAPMIANMQRFEEIRQKTLSADGSVEKKFAVMMATFNQSTANFGNEWGKTMEAVGHSVLPVLTPMMQRLTTITEKIGDFANANPRLTATLFIAAGALATLTAGGGALSIAMAGILGPIMIARYAITMFGLTSGGVFTAMTGGLRALAAAFLTNPIGLAITGIAIAAGLIYIYWDPIAAFFTSLWAGISDAFNTAWAAIRDGLDMTSIIQGLLTAMGPIGLFAGVIMDNWEPVKKFFIDLWSTITTAFSDAMVLITAGLDKIMGPINRVSESVSSLFGSDSPKIDTTAHPAIADTAAARSAVVAAPLAAAAAGGGSTQITDNSQTHINIQTQPNQSPQDVGRAVNDELDRRERARQTASRSRLYDGAK